MAQQEAERARLQVQGAHGDGRRDSETIARLQAVAAASETMRSDASEAARLRHEVADLQYSSRPPSRNGRKPSRGGRGRGHPGGPRGWQPVGEIPGSRKPRRRPGRPVIIDDLKVVEGIGPQVERSCSPPASRTGPRWPSRPQPLCGTSSTPPVPSSPTEHEHSRSRRCWPSAATHTLRSLQDSLRGGRVANRVEPQPGWVLPSRAGGLDPGRS